ncbi:MAG TPA: hypothetical protein VNJ07_06835 [Chitinophagales bacterium]|nr:hypothetical protein [Chitinophagales bacterium]
MAVNLHGVPRITNDLDVIISFSEDNVKKVEKVMHALGYHPRLPGVKPDDLSNEKLLKEWVSI